MKQLFTVIRILLGLMIVFSGANKFGNWLNLAYMQDAMKFVIEL